MERVDKKRKEEIMDRIKKAGSEEYETSWEKGIPISKKKTEIKKGKKSKTAGRNFELKVREDRERDGWIVDKWSNNVDLEENKMVKAKRKYNPFKKVLVIGTGFPDFIAFKKREKNYDVIGIEVKMNGILSKEEKEKCKWYLDNGIFSRILIASKTKDGRKIKVKYEDFEERYVK